MWNLSHSPGEKLHQLNLPYQIFTQSLMQTSFHVYQGKIQAWFSQGSCYVSDRIDVKAELIQTNSQTLGVSLRKVLDRLTPTSECVLEMWSIRHQCYKIPQTQGGAACLHHGDLENLEDIDFGVHLQTSEEHWGEDENKFTFRAKDIRSDNLLIQAYRSLLCQNHCKSFKRNICSGDIVIMFSFIFFVFWHVLYSPGGTEITW